MALARAAELYEPVLATIVHPLHHENYAWVMWALGQEADALRAARQAAEGSTEDNLLGAATWLGTGRLYEAAGHETAAVEAYIHAITLSPGLAKSPFWASSEFRQDEWPRIWSSAVATWSATPRQGIAAQMVGVPGSAEALDVLATAWTEENPKDVWGLEAAALASLFQENAERTERAEELCRVAPDSPGCFLTRGQAALAGGSEELGLRDLQAAIFVAPGDAYEHMAAWLLADWYWSHDQPEEATRWLQRFTPPSPAFDTRDTAVHGRRVLVSPLPNWPALRSLPAGVEAWQEARQWLLDEDMERELESLCQRAEEYDPFFDLCPTPGQ
jgi:tetratricopeptide (TPR) repeat protein